MTPQDVLDHYDRAALWPADRPDRTAAGLPAAYADALALRALRLARGERPVGYKVGFTNRTIWQRYGVFAPIWGPVWNTTLTLCDGRGSIDLAGTVQPRIEPEVVFGIAATPPQGATLEQLFACVEWIAPGFEIVQSHCEGWKFGAADTVADGGLHARLLVGRQRPLRDFASDGTALDTLLARTRLRLTRDGTQVEEGRGANVLDGPLHALLHFLHELQACPGAPALQPGEVVTTGTWTDAWPIAPGQVWRSEFDTPFDGLEVTLR
ncbi:2-oxo-3-hexenedioate decarboxylase [Variovorax sp. PDC80]|uniref:2-keto-4-pentenoate hydratase n=1 Tax=Variovorax sp. PDC80 TaxID=1882827 RepID=UPI0008EDCF1B|nr:hydratase [Variovorax sp. PDC80]SFO16424.1 2-oxo-3-hexenedioate decarboxylase [Variovorax sp. PDC80]